MSCYQYLKTLPLPCLITRVDERKKWLVLLSDFLDLVLPEPLRGSNVMKPLPCTKAASQLSFLVIMVFLRNWIASAELSPGSLTTILGKI